MWSIPFNNASESYWKSGSMELFLVAIAHPFLQTSKGTNSGWGATQLQWTNIRGEMKVFDFAAKWGELFICFQTSPLCGDEKLCEGMKWLKVGRSFASCIGFDNMGTCRALCSKVGFFFIISKSRCLAWLPCCNSSSFSGFLSHNAFHFPKKSLEKEVFAAFSSVRSDTVGDDVMEAYQRQHPHMHLTGLMFHNCTRKSFSTKQGHMSRLESELWRKTHFSKKWRERTIKN